MSDATASPTPPVGSAAGVAAVDAAPSLSALLASMQSLTLELSRRDAEQARRDAEQQARYDAELARRDAAHARLEVLLQTMLVRAQSPPPSISTAASVGTSTYHTLELQRAIEVFSSSSAAAAATEGDGGGDSMAPVMAAAILERLAACETEAALVVAATPSLCAARRLGDGAAGAAAALAASDPCPLVLVNSERRQWLDSRRDAPRQQLAHRLKPDLFMTWAPCWRGSARGGAAGNEGVLASRALQRDGCVRELYEAKLGEGELTMEDFGQLADYHTLLPGLCRGMLFNARHFWLYESNDGHPLRLIKAALGACGSLARMRSFFDDPARPLPDPPLIRTLRALMRALGVVPCERAPLAGSFLGAGASGRAFAVRYAAAPAPPGAPAPPPLALKVSCGGSRAELAYEFEQAAAAAAAGAPVVPVLARSLRILTGDDGRDAGGGFLLRDVLEPFAVTSAARCAAAFASLQALHASGFVHGDARLPNLLATGPRAEAAWIDMRAAAGGDVIPAAVQRAVDAEMLAASILQTSVSGLPRAVTDAVTGIAVTTAALAPDYAVLADAVFTALGVQPPPPPAAAAAAAS